MPHFPCYSSANVYIAPYSSATDGGELVTEFNQRAAMNTFGYSVIDLTKGSSTFVAKLNQLNLTIYNYDSYMSGCRKAIDCQLAIVGANLRIAAGDALIRGYYCQFMSEVLIPTSDIISRSDMGTNRPDDYVKSLYVKLHIATTSAPGNTHDDRLIPPIGGTYSVEVLIDDRLPGLNELLLGFITRDMAGRFTVLNNELKTRFISVDHIVGAENYPNLIVGPEQGSSDTTIYGIQSVTYDGHINTDRLTSINEWTWLGYNSVLGTYIRNFAKVPDDAGKPGGFEGDPNLTMLATMVGWATTGSSTQYIENTRFNKLIRMGADRISNNSDNPNYSSKRPYIQYRMIRSGVKAPDCYAEEEAYIPLATYGDRDRGTANLDDTSIPVSGVAGLMKPTTLWQHDQLWMDRDSFMHGVQYGPFLTKAVADDWFRQHPAVTPQLGDYYWVLSDTVPNYANPADPNPVETSYGTLSTTFTSTLTGNTVLQPKAQTIGETSELNLVADNFTGTFKGVATPRDENYNQFDVDGQVTSGTVRYSGNRTVTFEDIQGTLTGTGTATANAELTNFAQNVSARYVYQYDDPANPNPAAMSWQKQAVMRGFALPATPTTFGFVRPSSGSNLGDVINDPDTNQLRLDASSRARIQNGGWEMVDTAVSIQLNYNDFAKVASELTGKWFTKGCTIVLQNDQWDADSENTIKLSRIRGDITLEINQATPAAGATALVECEDINCLTLFTNQTDGKINVKDCVVTTYNFNSIYHWVNSRFTSGSNTAIVNNAWMRVTDAFSHSYENSLQVRFVTVTRGEYNVESAEMDIWIKRADWTSGESIEDFTMTSIKKLKFPPLYFTVGEGDAAIPEDMQYIPEELNAKVSGTAGTHRVWDDQQSQYVISGNWITTIDWEDGGELSVNGRVINHGEPLHGIYDVRFRALVQFTHADDMMEKQVPYSYFYN